MTGQDTFDSLLADLGQGFGTWRVHAKTLARSNALTDMLAPTRCPCLPARSTDKKNQALEADAAVIVEQQRRIRQQIEQLDRDQPPLAILQQRKAELESDVSNYHKVIELLKTKNSKLAAAQSQRTAELEQCSTLCVEQRAAGCGRETRARCVSSKERPGSGVRRGHVACRARAGRTLMRPPCERARVPHDDAPAHQPRMWRRFAARRRSCSRRSPTRS